MCFEMEPSSSSSSVPAATAISSQNGGLAQPSSRDDLFDIFGGGAEPELEIEISGGRYAPDAAPVPALPYQPPPPPPPLDSTYLSDTFPQPFDLGDPASSSAYPLFGGLDPARDTSILPSTSAFPVGLATTSLERSSPAATAQGCFFILFFPALYKIEQVLQIRYDALSRRKIFFFAVYFSLLMHSSSEDYAKFPA